MRLYQCIENFEQKMGQLDLQAEYAFSQAVFCVKLSNYPEFLKPTMFGVYTQPNYNPNTNSE